MTDNDFHRQVDLMTSELLEGYITASQFDKEFEQLLEQFNAAQDAKATDKAA